MNSILAILFVATTSVGAWTHAPAADSANARPIAAAITTWADVQDYIGAHATSIDRTAMALLEEEANAGVQTWVVFGTSSTGGSNDSSPLDGPGLGWPAPGRVILFATEIETYVAANMIMNVTESTPRFGMAPVRRLQIP